jgi:hypothetical protein
MVSQHSCYMYVRIHQVLAVRCVRTCCSCCMCANIRCWQCAARAGMYASSSQLKIYTSAALGLLRQCCAGAAEQFDTLHVGSKGA